MLRIFPYIFCLFLLSINPSLSKAPPPGTGSSNVPANILIMLDNSGSMTWDINGRYISSWTKYVRNPRDVETDSNGNIYVMEQNGKYRVFDKDGKSKYTNKGGGYGEGCNQWKFSYDFEIYDDKIYLLDYATSKLKIMSLGGACLANGNRQTGNSYEVASIAVSNNYVFIGGYTQIYQNWIKILNRSNLTQVRQDYQSKWKYNYYSLSGLKINNAENKLLTVSHYVTQPGSKQMVCVHSLSGTTIGECDSVGTENHNRGNGDFMYPVSADFDSNDNIIVNDLGNLRLQKFDSNGDYLSKYTPGRNWSSPFRSPDGIHINSDDKIYVADFSNNDVYEFDSNMSYVKRLGVPPSRMNIAKQVIKTIVNDSDLTGGANFGLMEWGSYSSRRLKLRVPIDKNGATNIFTDIDAVYGGGGTYLLQAMNYAKRYWSGNLNQGGKKYTSPIKTGQNCQLNFNVLISDGQWRSHSSAMAVVRNMKNNTNLKVKTFSVGLAINTGNRRNYDDLAKAGGTEKALYANSANELLQVLKDAILQAISGNLTFTTPAVMSELQKGNFIYQSTFKYEKHKQWEGSLKKYRLKNDGTFDTLQWDAATKLNSKSPGARNIWTAGIGVKNLNNITTSNRAVLKSALFPNKTNPTDTETDDLINFIRGFDSYDTDSDGKTDDTRHKLADIYNSELVVVGSPEASITDTGELNFSKTDNYYRQQNKYVDFRAGNSCGGSCSNRTEVVLAGANSGLLHAFKSLDGEELWSYIPPNIIGKISSIVTVRSNSTNPIYGVDGSPIVKDVIFDDTPNNGINDPRWRTVLMSGLGSGGHGYFALDITDINNPKHLFTIENDTYNKIINFWDIDENKNSFSYAAGSTVPEQYDYSKLGATWSQPRIIRLKIDGKDKWVAITGGGYNNAVSPDYGSNIYVIDISNGKVLKEIEISDNRIGYHAYSFGIPAGTKEFNVAPFGLTSYNTNLQKLIIEGPGGLGWGLTQNVDSSGVATNIKVVLDDITPVNLNFLITKVNKNDIVNSVPADLTVITADGSRFADYEGAMVYVPDLEGKITKINLTGNFTTTNNIISSSINKSTFFDAQANTDNGRYNYNELEATVNNDNNLWLYFGTGNSQKLQDQSSNIKNRVFGLMDKDFPNYSTKSFTYSNCSNNGCPSTTQVGWYLDLVKAQKITAKATIDKDRVYFPVYEPTNQANACKTGKAILQAYDSKCGKRLMNVEVGSGVLSEVVIMGDNLYVGLSGTANTNIQGFESKDNLITTKSKATASGKEVQIMKWKENY